MDATTQAQPLADRSTNTHLSTDKTDLKGSDISSMEYHRQVLQGKVASEEWVFPNIIILFSVQGTKS